MEFDINNTAAGTRVALKGRLTFAENGEFRDVLTRLGEGSAGRVVLDLEQVEFIDSAGLGMLLHARHLVQGRKGELALTGARDQVGRMLELARFYDLFANV